jgi:hypothetical protein
MRRTERYIEDTDRFPGWKGELPVPIQDFLNANSSSGQAPAALTIGVGADGKVPGRPGSLCMLSLFLVHAGCF